MRERGEGGGERVEDRGCEREGKEGEREWRTEAVRERGEGGGERVEDRGCEREGGGRGRESGGQRL